MGRSPVTPDPRAKLLHLRGVVAALLGEYRQVAELARAHHDLVAGMGVKLAEGLDRAGLGLADLDGLDGKSLELLGITENVRKDYAAHLQSARKHEIRRIELSEHLADARKLVVSCENHLQRQGIVL